MFDWTVYDIVRAEHELREDRLNQAGARPRLSSRRPMRPALAGTLVWLAGLVASERVVERSAGRMATGGADG